MAARSQEERHLRTTAKRVPLREIPCAMQYEVTLRLSVEVSDGEELREAALRAFAETHHVEPDDVFAAEAVRDVPGALSTLLGGTRVYQTLASVIDASGSSLVGVYAERGQTSPGANDG